MYRRYACIFMLIQLVLLLTMFNVKSIQMNRNACMNTERINETQKEYQIDCQNDIRTSKESRPVIAVGVIQRKPILKYSDEDYNNLLKIVEAEAGGEDRTGKLLVANVVINRVKNEKFPDTITDVIFQKEKGISQFSPVGDGRISKVIISEDTKEVVESAIYGEDVSEGALYFAARKYASKERMAWFDKHLKKLFTYGGHEFFL